MADTVPVIIRCINKQQFDSMTTQYINLKLIIYECSQLQTSKTVKKKKIVIEGLKK